MNYAWLSESLQRDLVMRATPANANSFMLSFREVSADVEIDDTGTGALLGISGPFSAIIDEAVPVESEAEDRTMLQIDDEQFTPL